MGRASVRCFRALGGMSGAGYGMEYLWAIVYRRRGKMQGPQGMAGMVGNWSFGSTRAE